MRGSKEGGVARLSRTKSGGSQQKKEEGLEKKKSPEKRGRIDNRVGTAQGRKKNWE